MQGTSSKEASSATQDIVPPYEIREKFSRAMSDMYKKEVPLYGDLLEIVRGINAEFMAQNPALEDELGSLDRVSEERHGAIRLGKPEELAVMARLFNVMGMLPVGYYDLSVANLPVHSTAFRPVDKDELARNPFRVFTSLLRMDLLDDETRRQAEESLRDRDIFTPGVRALIRIHENEGGLTPEQADDFIREALETFRWHSDARVSQEQYETFLSTSSLLADIASFKGPHINHLTPRVLDIMALHRRMVDMGIETIPEVQGPPAGWPILLQQTSFRALVETTRFPDGRGGSVDGRHRARFGEIEQRHTALKPQAMAIYDQLTARAKEESVALRKKGEKVYRARYQEMLDGIFKEGFPARTNEELRLRDFGYFTYELTEKGRIDIAALKEARATWRKEAKSGGGDASTRNDHGPDRRTRNILASLIERKLVRAVPVTYEDFLPVSAAGIFKSNLDERSGLIESGQSANRGLLEKALGKPVGDYHALYRQQEGASIRNILTG